MKAFVLNQYKEPLQQVDVPEPVLGDHDVLVEVHAAGLNQLDEKIRLGEFKQILPYKLPQVLGHDVAGVVLKVGPAVRSFTPGDEVFARPGKDSIGTFAERIAVAEEDLAIKPATISMEEAGSLPLVALTAWAGAGGARERWPRPEGLHPCRRRGSGLHRHSAGQVPGRHRGYHGQCREQGLCP